MDKRDYEVAVDDFEVADRAYKEMEEYFLSGNFIPDILQSCEGDPDRIKENFLGLRERLKELLEDRNVKLSQAQTAMRALVSMNPSQWRGYDGKASTVRYGPFTVMSKTRRNFHGPSLIRQAAKYGCLDELMKLEGFDDEGNVIKLVKQEISVSYQHVLNWLLERQLYQVIDGAYDESEMTATVQGAKPLSFLGEKKEK